MYTKHEKSWVHWMCSWKWKCWEERMSQVSCIHHHSHCFANDPTSPLNHWSLQKCQTNKNSRYARFELISLRLVGVSVGTNPHLLRLLETLENETTTHKSWNISQEFWIFWNAHFHMHKNFNYFNTVIPIEPQKFRHQCTFEAT